MGGSLSNKQALPTTREEMDALGIDRLDVVLVTGDCYVDHPSFGVAVVGRHLQSLGLNVGVIPAPDPDNLQDFMQLGEPRLFFGVTAGALDSMVMLRTALNKPRSDDAYAEGGMAGKRPARAVITYCNRIRQAFKGARIIIGGLEASLRRFAHYDYWEDKVRGSILPDSKADILVYGMGERPLEEIVQRLKEGMEFKDIRNVPGAAVMISQEERKAMAAGCRTIPSLDEVRGSKVKYARASKMIHMNQNPGCAQSLVQKHGARYLLVNPPAKPLSAGELDSVYALPFTRKPHPVHQGRIPAYEMIKDSVTAMRGCFGGCGFCALTVHQGRAVVSRSEKSILDEVRSVASMKGFSGYISDIGGPTANMYRMVCAEPEVEAVCRRVSCVYPKICKRLVTDHEPQIRLLRKARKVGGVKKVFVASGVRYDLANLSEEYIRELAGHHVSGQLKVAPEHVSPGTLALMRKPQAEVFDEFAGRFLKESSKAGLEQYVVSYFISAHPGSRLEEEVELAQYLKKRNMRPRQIQDFIPLPMTLSGDMYYSGMDPLSGREVFSEKGGKGRRLHRALIQYFKPENQDDVRTALKMAGREDLIGHGPGKLVGRGSMANRSADTHTRPGKKVGSRKRGFGRRS